jgi:type II secretory pathway pseudopilin PulG
MPIQFSCPNCGKQTVVADEFGGQTGPCAACGAMVTIPPATFKPMGPTGGGGSGGASVLFVVLAIAGVCVLLCGGLAAALVLPAVQSARGAARKAQSMNNLKQIALALHNYESVHRTFPPAVVTDADGKPLYSGRVLLLPFLEQDGLYQQFDKSKAWDSPENLPISMRMVPTFIDPASKRTEPNRSDYVFVTGTGTIFDGKQAVPITAITDGTSNTLMLIETSTGPANWAAPQEWNADSGQLPAGNHPRVILAAFADGSVRQLEPSKVQSFIKQLTVRNDGQAIPNF